MPKFASAIHRTLQNQAKLIGHEISKQLKQFGKVAEKEEYDEEEGYIEGEYEEVKAKKEEKKEPEEENALFILAIIRHILNQTKSGTWNEEMTQMLVPQLYNIYDFSLVEGYAKLQYAGYDAVQENKPKKPNKPIDNRKPLDQNAQISYRDIETDSNPFAPNISQNTNIVNIDTINSIIDEISNISGIYDVDKKYHEFAINYAQKRAAELVAQLEKSTREMLKNDLVKYIKDKLTPEEIADKLKETYAFSYRRSLTIARTETGFCWNYASIQQFQMAGARGVHVYDGDYDIECITADGQNWTFQYAMQHLLEHPNCVRQFGIMPDSAEFDRV